MVKVDREQKSCFGEIAIGVWESADFLAAAFQDAGAIRLSVIRQDMKDGIGWDELQRIKSECGFGDRDAVEFYPRDADVLNTGNLRHLYIMDEKLPLIRRGPHGF